KDPLAVAGLGDQAEAARAVTEQGPVALPEEMPDRYRSATVTVLPSWEEAFGLVLAESLACGTPAVCTTEGGMTEVVDSPEVGRTAPFGDVDALARALDEATELAARPGTAAACAGHARRWGWVEAVGPAHLALYERVLGGRRPVAHRSATP
ncbi:MAG TPA: glycosyltransferase, partial [Acidimicrobiales bacterium]|nr:glycosyltransferase [Acidimicrobiales bacterium]